MALWLAQLNYILSLPREGTLWAQVQMVSLLSLVLDNSLHTYNLFCDHKTNHLGKTENFPLLFRAISKGHTVATTDILSLSLWMEL